MTSVDLEGDNIQMAAALNPTLMLPQHQAPNLLMFVPRISRTGLDHLRCVNVCSAATRVGFSSLSEQIRHDFTGADDKRALYRQRGSARGGVSTEQSSGQWNLNTASAEKKNNNKKINLQAGFQQSHNNSRNNESHPAKGRLSMVTLTSVLGVETRGGSERFWTGFSWFTSSVCWSVRASPDPSKIPVESQRHHGATRAHYAGIRLPCQHRHREKKKKLLR